MSYLGTIPTGYNRMRVRASELVTDDILRPTNRTVVASPVIRAGKAIVRMIRPNGQPDVREFGARTTITVDRKVRRRDA